MRTNINQGRIQPLAVMIVMLINNDQTPYLTYYRILGLTVHAISTHCFQLPSPRSPENLSVMKSSRYPVLLESFWQSHSGFHASALPGISAPLLSPKNVADKFYRLPFSSIPLTVCAPTPPMLSTRTRVFPWVSPFTFILSVGELSPPSVALNVIRPLFPV